MRATKISILVSILLLAACAQKRPVLYPNHHLRTVGTIRAQADTDACLRLAADYGVKTDISGRIAKETAEVATTGAAGGAAAGAVVGRPGRGAAVGAAGGGAAAATRGVIRSGDPDPVFRRFVERCLRDKGYEPIGWR